MKDKLLGRSILAIEVIILVGVTIHAPLSVWLGTVFPGSDELIKAWKELLMGIGALLLAMYVTRRRDWHIIWNDWVVRLVAGYGLLHIVLLAWKYQGMAAAAAGLMIDLRYLLFFVMVYITVRYVVESRRVLLIGAAIGAAIVVGFAVLQLTILPADILAHIGYSKQTISPYLTVDMNHNYIRINSTLRGPNPVGAYAAMCLAMTIAFVMQRQKKLTRMQGIISGLLVVGGAAALWASYSRSAVVAGIIMVVAVMALSTSKRVPRTWWVIGLAIFIGLFGSLIASHGKSFVDNVVLHDNPTSTSTQKSNDGHVQSLREGVSRMIEQPLGGGIGSTGSASLLGDTPLTIENQYLFIAHETGWLGLLLFLGIIWYVLRLLWGYRSDWLALGLFVSGIGLTAIGMLLPVWADDTVSIIWWGLAGLALGYPRRVYGKNHARN